jgi:hypothetical protein
MVLLRAFFRYLVDYLLLMVVFLAKRGDLFPQCLVLSVKMKRLETGLYEKWKD